MAKLSKEFLEEDIEMKDEISYAEANKLIKDIGKYNKDLGTAVRYAINYNSPMRVSMDTDDMPFTTKIYLFAPPYDYFSLPYIKGSMTIDEIVDALSYNMEKVITDPPVANVLKDNLIQSLHIFSKNLEKAHPYHLDIIQKASRKLEEDLQEIYENEV